MGSIVNQLRALLVPLGPGVRTLLLRLVGRFGFWWVLSGAVVVLYAAVRYRTWIVWMLTAFCVAAWIHAPHPDAQAAKDEPNEEPEEAGEEPHTHSIPGLLWDLIGEAPGVHLKTLTERLQVAAPRMALDRAVVRGELAALGIPVRASVRDAAGRVNEGVHRDDLKAWEQTLPATAPVPLPKTRSSPVATALTSDLAERRRP